MVDEKRRGKNRGKEEEDEGREAEKMNEVRWNKRERKNRGYRVETLKRIYLMKLY